MSYLEQTLGKSFG